MVTGGPSFPSQQQAGNSSSGNNSSGANSAAGGQPNPQNQLPIASVTRIMRSVLPTHAHIEKESKEYVGRHTTRFISCITAEANRQCQLEHRRIVTSEDIIGAMTRLGFGRYAEAVTIYLARLREQNEMMNNGAAHADVDPRQAQAQAPRVHVPAPHEDVPVAPGTPPPASAFHAPNPVLMGGVSGDEGSGGSESEFDDGDVEHVNRRNNFSG